MPLNADSMHIKYGKPDSTPIQPQIISESIRRSAQISPALSVHNNLLSLPKQLHHMRASTGEMPNVLHKLWETLSKLGNAVKRDCSCAHAFCLFVLITIPVQRLLGARASDALAMGAQWLVEDRASERLVVVSFVLRSFRCVRTLHGK
jgi:hypothetical protein